MNCSTDTSWSIATKQQPQIFSKIYIFRNYSSSLYAIFLLLIPFFAQFYTFIIIIFIIVDLFLWDHNFVLSVFFFGGILILFFFFCNVYLILGEGKLFDCWIIDRSIIRGWITPLSLYLALTCTLWSRALFREQFNLLNQ